MKSPILAREKMAPIQAQMITKIQTRVTFIKITSKQQHVKFMLPQVKTKWKTLLKTFDIFRKGSPKLSQSSSQPVQYL